MLSGHHVQVIRYPDESEVLAGGGQRGFGVGPHKDYGFLTVLAQDDVGGLQVQVDVVVVFVVVVFVVVVVVVVVVVFDIVRSHLESGLMPRPSQGPLSSMLERCLKRRRAESSRPRHTVC